MEGGSESDLLCLDSSAVATTSKEGGKGEEEEREEAEDGKGEKEEKIESEQKVENPEDSPGKDVSSTA